jgi:hypothetical protein
VIPSWNADTPPGAWIVVELQARLEGGVHTRWHGVARWAYGDARRASAGGEVDVDTFVAADSALLAYRLSLELVGSARVTRVAAVAAAARDGYVQSATTMSRTLDLEVPQYSQGFATGGESWCSAASTAMVLAYWQTGPGTNRVAHAAQHVYDQAYDGTGNWAFNVAYAAQFGLVGSVTRLRSLVDAEQLVQAGVPLVASIKVEPGALDGFLLPSSSGHLLVIGGFTSDGDVIAYDPAATSDATVRRLYVREQFERAWLGGSGGVVYLIHPPAHALPPSSGSW